MSAPKAVRREELDSPHGIERRVQPSGPESVFGVTAIVIAVLLAPATPAHDPLAPNPFCLIQGPATAPCGANVTYVATAPNYGQPFNATWSFLNNNAGATFVGPNTCLATQSCSVVVTTSQNGSVVIRVILDFG